MSESVVGRAASLGVRDTLRFNFVQTVPQLLRGTFSQRAGMSSLLARTLRDPQGIHLVSGLRRRYERDFLWVKMAGKRSLLVLDQEGIRAVLDASPTPYGPPDLKVRGMSHFQPGAVTISAGEDWGRRRAFNEEVLGSGHVLHPEGADFLQDVERSIDGLLSRRGATVAWRELSEAFEALTGSVVLGRGVETHDVFAHLDALMKRANRILPAPDAEAVAAFQTEIRERVRSPEAGGLAARACPHMGSGDPLPVAGQIPHWLFAMKGTLAINCGYALALIASDSTVQRAVRAELDGVDLSCPEAVDGVQLLDGCLREAMRLWPTTPLIVRAVRRDVELGGIPIAAGEQVIIHNGFNHRHPEAFPEPDRFRPDRWVGSAQNYWFNALSNGPQACAGRELVFFLGKAVLGRLLQADRWVLRSPALRSGVPIPHAFDHTALLLGRERSSPGR